MWMRMRGLSPGLRLAARAVSAVSSAAAAAHLAEARAAAHTTDASHAADAPADARLRRQTTMPIRYHAGAEFRIVRVPQRIAGVDVGHISVLVRINDTFASFGLYPKGYRDRLPMLSSDVGMLVTPDPLYARAARDAKLRDQIVVLHHGALDESQAASLNRWTDDDAGALSLTQFKTSEGVERELGTTPLAKERYQGLAMPGSANRNCATFVEDFAPGCIKCPLGIPRLCRAVVHEDAAPR